MSSTQLLPSNFQPYRAFFEAKNILVSGAGSEIGYSMALGLAEWGATVLLLERKERIVAPLYDEIVKRGYPEPMVVTLDLNKAEEQHLDQLVQGLANSFSSLDGLIHMESGAAPLAPVTLSKATTWHSVYRRSLINPMLLTRALLPLLEKPENASVVFCTLAAGRKGSAYWGPVGAMGSALENLNQTLADEYQSIRFNTLDIGKVNTAIRHKYFPAEAKSTLRPHDDPEIVNYFLYLISEHSIDITGQMFTVPDIEPPASSIP